MMALWGSSHDSQHGGWGLSVPSSGCPECLNNDTGCPLCLCLRSANPVNLVYLLFKKNILEVLCACEILVP